jgi:putative thioredoxin
VPRGWSGSFRRFEETAAQAVVVNVDEANFEHAVVDRSFRNPVVVEVGVQDCCMSYRELSQLLERLARGGSGRWVLAKIDADVAPRLVQALGVQSVPKVFMVLNAQLTLLFEGTPRPEAVREFIEAVESAGRSPS